MALTSTFAVGKSVRLMRNEPVGHQLLAVISLLTKHPNVCFCSFHWFQMDLGNPSLLSGVMIGCGKVGVQQLSFEVVTAEGSSVEMCQKVFIFAGKIESREKFLHYIPLIK